MDAYDGLAPLYDHWAEHMTEDVPFYVSLAREAGPGPVVELAVGTGRVAVEIARQTGRRVVGIDLSAGMLARARARAADAGVSALVDLRQGDMRELGRGPLALDAPAALVICPFRSLLHLRGARKAALFQAVHDTLAPGGRFAWNSFVFDPHVAASNDGYAARHGELWEYIEHEGIVVPSIYFSHERDIVVRAGSICPVSSFFPARAGEKMERRMVRFRTVGDMTCTAGVDTPASSPRDVIRQIIATRQSEREARLDDTFSEAAMEDRKREGYF